MFLLNSTRIRQGPGFELGVVGAEVLYVDGYLSRADKFVCLDCREYSLCYTTDGYVSMTAMTDAPARYTKKFFYARSGVRSPILIKEAFGAVPDLRPTRRDLCMAEIAIHILPDAASGMQVRLSSSIAVVWCRPYTMAY